MNDLIRLSRIIPATEIATKWQVTDERLDELAVNANLPHYTIHEKRESPSTGQIVYFCSGPYRSFLDPDYEFVLKGSYFNAEDIDAFEAANPEILWDLPSGRADAVHSIWDHGWPPAPREQSEDITAEDVRRDLGMSPSQFVDMLNGKNGPRLITSDEDAYEEHNTRVFHFAGGGVQIGGGRKYFTTDRLTSLPALLINRIDLQAYLSERQGAASSASDAPALKAQLAEVQAERDKLSKDLEKATAKIAELETANPVYDMVQGRDAQVAALQSEVETVRGLINQHGALSVVVKMLEGGSTKEDIASFLKGKSLSYSQIGILLHADPLSVSGDAVTMCAKRLLGITSK